MNPKETRAVDIIAAVSELSPYKDTDANLHFQWVMGYLAGSLSDCMDYDSRLMTAFVRRLKLKQRPKRR